MDPHAHPTVIDLFAFGRDSFVEERNVDVGHVPQHVGKWSVLWVNVEGLADAAVVRAIGDIFALHPLALEDVINVHQRPKVEAYDGQLFIVSRMVTLENDEIETEQLSMLVGAGFVVTFQERPGDVLDPVRERIRTGAQLRGLGPDYLAYAMIDAVVDHYFPVLERYGERLEELEHAVTTSADGEVLAAIHKSKHDLLVLRRAIWPQRDALAELYRDPVPLVAEATRPYLRDCYDHTVQVIDLVETLREMSTALLDVHLSMMGNRINEVMKVLTVFAAVFIPLTFITGVYGMNFDTGASAWNMPELDWRFGYPFALALMVSTAMGTLAYFRLKGWIGRRRSRYR